MKLQISKVLAPKYRMKEAYVQIKADVGQMLRKLFDVLYIENK